MTKILYLLILWIAYPTNVYASISSVEVTSENVTTVRTALGYSTMLNFDQKPTSAVIGDQDAFKVEFISNSISVKPLLPNARTNLFVFTEYGRYSFRLTCGAADAAQYSINIKRASRKSAVAAGMSFKKINATSPPGPIVLKVTEIEVPPSKKALLIRYQVQCSDEFDIASATISLTQNGEGLTLQERYTDTKSCGPKNSPSGVAVIRSNHLSLDPLVLEIAPPGAHPVKVSFQIPRS